MSTSTITLGHLAATDTNRTAIKPHLNLLERFMAWRQRSSDTKVGEAFARMADTQLADIGFTPDQVSHVRATGRVPTSYWG